MPDPDLSQFMATPKAAPPAGAGSDPDLSRFMGAGASPQPPSAAPGGAPDLSAFMGTAKPTAPAAKPAPTVQWDKPKGMVQEVKDDFRDVAKERTDALKHDFTTKPGHGLPLRVAKTAMDVGNYALGPLEAAGRATVGRAAGDVAGMVDQGMGKSTTPSSRDAVKRNIGDLAGAAVPLEGPVKAATGAAKLPEKIKAAEKILSPGTVNDEARAAANLHRQILGKRGVEADKAAYALGQHQKVVGNASPADQLSIIRYVESRSKGGTPLDPKFKPAADAIKKVADGYRKQIEYVMGKNGPSFVQDYYARMWKQKPADVERALVAGKQGSGRSLKARSLPTYEDGLKAGLTPVYPNPIDAMTAYADNMGRFLATHEILDGMEKSPQIGAKWFARGAQPEGWVPLDGVKTREPEARIIAKDKGVTGRQPEKQLYAPEGAARVYNNYISKGLDRGDVGPLYRGARVVSNGLVQLKLGLSAFHAAVMGQEGIFSEMARGLKQLSRGDVKGLGTVAASPAAPIRTAMRGAKMGNEILEKGPGSYGVGKFKVPSKALDQLTGRTAPSQFNGQLNKVWERTGQRLGMDKIYATRKGTSLFSSALRGTFQRDLQQALQTTYKGSAGDRVKGVLDLTGNIIQSTAAPLFEHYIPNMKRGAWAQQMSDFLKANPSATEAEQVAYGQKLADSIDNRFGELVVDNNFWNKSAYQIGQLLMLSPSWNIGTVREIGGGVANIPKSMKGLIQGKGIDDKTAYTAALVGTTMLQNAALTYLHTGQMPEGADYFAYRTGGTDAATGKPERAMLPGYMKDVLAWMQEGVGQEAMNKVNPGLKSAVELLTDKDYKNQPIYNPNDPLEKRAGQVGEYAAEQASPIAFGESSKPKKGSQLTGLERFMSVRPAPRYLTDPKGVQTAARKRNQRDWKVKTKTDARMKAREADQ